MESSPSGTADDRETGWVVAIGASTGGFAPLGALIAQLPQDFPASVLVVQHIGPYRSGLAQRLARCGVLPARDASDREPLRPGVVYVAPPDAHLLAGPRHLQLSHGPKINHTRPAIDPLLRTCAIAHGPRAIGVVLSGLLDDGTAGLQDIKLCGGLAIVQDPGTAEAREMPMSALDNVAVDHCLPPESIGQLLARTVAQPPPPLHWPEAALARIRREQAASEGRDTMAFLSAHTEPTMQTCPDCGGTLWQVRGSQPPRYACHTGHVFSLNTLARAQYTESEHVLRSAVRALRERAALQREIEALERARGNAEAALLAGHEAHAARHQADGLMQLIEREASGNGRPG
ncbi:chemotaxis protein CheB [Pseudorhodoferax soli]|uniref:protein-glutamate methylesterase n=1 Tax=Pseudorhodoferax soli TaxID=545864 RepID=A0A368XYE6_9BURK|nr:chemotaxis protein CheB [Pseudorhodoferax soli]RCW72489.1 two-component system chemotaxis response regulator CheB [Pseudorhodoferax soli]